MFTGIVKERGRVASMQQELEALRLEIDAPETASALGIGDSVSISGACLTATAVSNGRFSVTAVAETLDRTTLRRLAPEDEVNLETATRAGDPLGGHFVQGHVDAVGRIASVEDGRVWVEAGPRSCATASRRARLRSTASRSRSPLSGATRSRSR